MPVSNLTEKSSEVVLTRTFNAPREMVFQAWIKPEHLAEWWGLNPPTMRETVAPE